jgi:O-antigen/teichoic acid export membrane protein
MRNYQNLSFVSNLLQMFGTDVLSRLLQILTGIMTARMLGPHDRGVYSMLLLLPQTLELFLKFGIAPANTYMIRREKEKVADVASNSILFAFGLGSIGIILGIIFREHLSAKVLWQTGPAYIMLTICMLPFNILKGYSIAIFYAVSQFKLANLRSIANSAALLIGMFFVMVVLRMQLFAALMVNVTVSVFIAVWLIWTIQRLYPLSLRLNLELGKKTVRFGVKSYMQGIVNSLHLRLDHYLIAFYLSPDMVAFYSIAMHLAYLIGEIPSVVTRVLYPKLSGSPPESAHRMTILVCRHMLFIEGLAALAIALMGKMLIVAWYGEAYAPAAEPLYIILPGLVMMSLFTILGRNFTSRNKQQANILSSSLALLANILLNLVLIPRMGINGAALASTISYSLATAVLLTLFLKESKYRLKEMIRVEKSDLLFYKDFINRSWSHLKLMVKVESTLK